MTRISANDYSAPVSVRRSQSRLGYRRAKRRCPIPIQHSYSGVACHLADARSGANEGEKAGRTFWRRGGMSVGVPVRRRIPERESGRGVRWSKTATFSPCPATSRIRILGPEQADPAGREAGGKVGRRVGRSAGGTEACAHFGTLA